MSAPRFGEWQPIETAPKDGTRILVARAGGCVGVDEIEIVDWFVIERTDYVQADGGLYRKVVSVSHEGWNGNGHRATHWMPLPEPPK